MRPGIEELGSTPDDAISTGLRKLGLTRDRVLVEILGHQASTPPGMSMVRLTPLVESPDSLRIAEFLGKILTLMGIEASITMQFDEGRLVLNLESEAGGLIIGRNGSTIDSLQHVLNRMWHRLDNGSCEIVLDIAGYRKRKELNLISIAHQTAKKVKETGQVIRLAPMNPHDRRIVHLELEDDPKVTTASVGYGFMKCIEILPVAGQRKSGRK